MATLAMIDLISGWWNELELAGRIFYGLGIISGIVALLLVGLSIMGMEHHDAIDAVDSADVDHGGGGIFSIKPLTGFFLGFGWVGAIALNHGFSLTVAIVAALVAGVLVMAVIVMMFRAIMGMRSDGTMRITDTVGAVGTVYITLPAGKVAGGQVTVSFRGRQETLPALNTSDRVLPSGEKIRVVSVIDTHTVLVEPL